jgi:hypothetical protein
MAMAFGISALITAIRANLSYAAAICVVLLCSETLLILRWWCLRRPSAQAHGVNAAETLPSMVKNQLLKTPVSVTA